MKKTRKTEFSKIPNSVTYDKKLSLKAKGLYTYMVAKPRVWDFSCERIALENKDGKSSVNSAMKELIEHELLKRTKFKGCDGKWQWKHELVVEYKEIEVQSAESEYNPATDYPLMEKDLIYK